MTNFCPWRYRTLAYLEDALDPGDAESVAAHIAHCTSCAKLARDLEQDTDFLQRATDTPQGHPAPVAPMLAIAKRRAKRRSLAQAAATACIALLAAIPILHDPTGAVPAQNETELATWNADVERLERRLESLDTLIAGLETGYAPTQPARDPQWLRDEGAAAILIRTAELLESDFGMHETATTRYQQIADQFPNTAAGKTARRLLGHEAQVN